MSPAWSAPLILSSVLVAAPAIEKAGPGFLGIQIRNDPASSGIQVVMVLDASPADKAGVKTGDLITKLDGEVVGAVPDFVKTIAGHKPGDKVTLHILRDGNEIEIKATLGEAPKPKPEQKQEPKPEK